MPVLFLMSVGSFRDPCLVPRVHGKLQAPLSCSSCLWEASGTPVLFLTSVGSFGFFHSIGVAETTSTPRLLRTFVMKDIGLCQQPSLHLLKGL